MEKKRMKRFLTAVALLLCLFCVAYGTWAYFTAEEHVTNVITTGSISIEIDENSKNTHTEILDSDGNVTGLSFTGIMPGQDVSKIVNINNTGTGDAWIRAKVSCDIVAADKTTSLPVVFENGELVVREITPPKLKDKEGNIIEWNWFYCEADKYYYCKSPVEPGGWTGTLFEEVNFHRLMDNRYQGCTANITITAEAIQVKNNNRYEVKGEDGNFLKDVAGNPVTDEITELSPENLHGIKGWETVENRD